MERDAARVEQNTDRDDHRQREPRPRRRPNVPRRRPSRPARSPDWRSFTRPGRCRPRCSRSGRGATSERFSASRPSQPRWRRAEVGAPLDARTPDAPPHRVRHHARGVRAVGASGAGRAAAGSRPGDQRRPSDRPAVGRLAPRTHRQRGTRRASWSRWSRPGTTARRQPETAEAYAEQATERARVGWIGHVTQFSEIDFAEAYERGLSLSHAVEAARDWIIGGVVFGPLPFAWGEADGSCRPFWRDAAGRLRTGKPTDGEPPVEGQAPKPTDGGGGSAPTAPPSEPTVEDAPDPEAQTEPEAPGRPRGTTASAAASWRAPTSWTARPRPPSGRPTSSATCTPG